MADAFERQRIKQCWTMPAAGLHADRVAAKNTVCKILPSPHDSFTHCLSLSKEKNIQPSPQNKTKCHTPIFLLSLSRKFGFEEQNKTT
ncbi:hypothetical protein MAF45_07160 [Mesosutterella sp. OilRF-GAM-744-9]|uniref:Uncharacterized protein n=1 Tax=Mesosutterella porci TaxID=2915351 RepID=A0ABS9MRK1_9BURK|nr:hypothetical protein [Mesosutterella sp. oilRF-744-WT-GAM-9]MCI6530897.1 hypothetical protein [Mesosutterella sp.]